MGHYTLADLGNASRIAPATDSTIVDDAVLDWTPILGAKTYDLQISTDANFLTIVHAQSSITGTSFARPRTLNNDQYYWRVRATDALGNVQDWAGRPVWRFQRAWPDRPEPVYPANNVSVGDPFYFQWTPTRLASRYVIEMSPNQTFTPPSSVSTCTSANTTLTPDFAPSDSCMPGALGTYYWRVFAYDDYVNQAALRATRLRRRSTGSPTPPSWCTKRRRSTAQP